MCTKIFKGNNMISFRVLRTPLIAAALASAAFCSHAAGNLLINGDFELNINDVGNGGYQTVNAGSSLITGWTVGGTSVDLILNNYGSINSVSIDLAGSPGPGTLEQSFAQVAGETYTLTWQYFRNDPGTDLTVTFGGTTTTYTDVMTISSAATASLTYTAATGGTGSVLFASGNGSYGPTIDNVSVTAVPEPEGIVLALAGLGMLGAARARRSKA
jgi:MYXO-CTERM domain-containing protein